MGGICSIAVVKDTQSPVAAPRDGLARLCPRYDLRGALNLFRNQPEDEDEDGELM